MMARVECEQSAVRDAGIDKQAAAAAIMYILGNAVGLTQSLWRAPDTDPALDRISIGDSLRRAARRWPDREAMVYAHQAAIADTRLTYGALDTLTDRLAAALLADGYQPGERVAIWGPNHPAWIVLEYALAKAGLVIVALNPLYKALELRHALADSRAVGLFHADTAGGGPMRDIVDAVRAELPALRAVHDFTGDVEALLQRGGDAGALPDVDPAGLFMIQYTSGTTGVPKAALLPHAGVATIAARSYQSWQFGPGDRVCHGFPMFHVGGSANSTPGSLIVGATTLPIYIFKAREALDILEQERCTGFIGVPTMLAAMMEDPSFGARDLSALRRIVVGGAPVPSPFLRRCEAAFGVEMLNGYGQTESCGVMTSVRSGDDEHHKTETSGVALPGVNLKVVGADGAILPCGETGELCVRGPGMMMGYGDPQASARAFDAEGWLRTGDLATMDAEGYVRIVGRLKEMIIRGGENLYPAEIERHLIDHPDVAEAAVIGIPDPKYGEEVCAVLRPRSPDHVAPEVIRAWCQDRLSRWKVPRHVVWVEAMPTTPSGKIRKHELKDRIIGLLAIDDVHPGEKAS